jgi:hypothetical protein
VSHSVEWNGRKEESPVASANRRKRRTKSCCAPGKNRARVCVGDLGKLQGPSSEARDRERLKSRNIQGAIVFGCTEEEQCWDQF